MNFARVAVFSIFITSPVYAGEYVLMQPSDAEALVEQCTRDTPAIEGSWQPSMADIEELEANIGKLKDIEATGCCGSGLLKGNPADYNRQYAGVIINGEQRIYINAVPGRSIQHDPAIFSPRGILRIHVLLCRHGHRLYLRSLFSSPGALPVIELAGGAGHTGRLGRYGRNRRFDVS